MAYRATPTCPRKKKRQIHALQYALKVKYGLTIMQYLTRIVYQDNRCALCGRGFPKSCGLPAVDHCHKTKTNRGILCSPCNVGLGLFRDDPALLRRAAQYLGEYTPPT